MTNDDLYAHATDILNTVADTNFPECGGLVDERKLADDLRKLVEKAFQAGQDSMKERIAELERTRDAIQADSNRALEGYRGIHDKATELWKLLNEIGYPTTGGDVYERATHAIRNLGGYMKRNTREGRILDLVQRWCRRPESVLKEGAMVLANDAEMWCKLREAVLK